jgi:hypothetical protein
MAGREPACVHDTDLRCGELGHLEGEKTTPGAAAGAWCGGEDVPRRERGRQHGVQGTIEGVPMPARQSVSPATRVRML